MAVKLSELLDHPPFGLRLVTSAAAEDRIVLGVTPTDGANPGRWLAPGYLVMTSGIALRGSIEKQTRFIEEVHQAGAPAVGLSLNETFKSAPEAMIKRSEELGLPMFTAPYALPWREISSFIMRAAAAEEDQGLSRDHGAGLPAGRPQRGRADHGPGHPASPRAPCGRGRLFPGRRRPCGRGISPCGRHVARSPRRAGGCAARP